MVADFDGWPTVIVGVAAELDSLFAQVLPGQWQQPAAHVGWTCWMTADHICADFAHYAAQVLGQPQDHYVKFSFDTSRANTAAELREVVAVAGGMLASAVRTAPPQSTGWHPHGFFTPAGFAAIGAAEGLVHGHDIAAGLSIDWRPQAALCERVVDTVFPDAARLPSSSAFRALLAATGRAGPDAGESSPAWTYSAAAARPLM